MKLRWKSNCDPDSKPETLRRTMDVSHDRRYRYGPHTLLMPHVCALIQKQHATHTQPYPPSGGPSVACFSLV